MQDKTLYILRGVSGSGKSTLAEVLENTLPSAKAIAADDYFYDDLGEYCFDVDLLGHAHNWCKGQVAGYMNEGYWQYSNVILHNTNTSEKEIKPYIELANHFGYKVVSLVVENRHGSSNVHDVPDTTLERQERKLRSSIKLT